MGKITGTEIVVWIAKLQDLVSCSEHSVSFHSLQGATDLEKVQLMCSRIVKRSASFVLINSINSVKLKRFLYQIDKHL